jgi:hypothetical protein
VARLIYADTSIWNCLCNQKVYREPLLSSLTAQDAQLVLGENVLSEMAKTFQNSDPCRGRELFSYLKSFLGFGIPLLKPTWAMLIQEALHLLKQGPEAAPLAADHAQLFRQVEKLSEGEFDSRVRHMVLELSSEAYNGRVATRAHLNARPKLRSILRQVPIQRLPRWIARQASGPRGREVLAGHLHAQFPSETLKALSYTAKRLLASHRYRASHALVKSDLYLNWRCAVRGSLRSDVPDDMFHVVNASYCDIFITTDSDQASYAGHALYNAEVLVYDGTTPLLKWLLEATRHGSRL